MTSISTWRSTQEGRGGLLGLLARFGAFRLRACSGRARSGGLLFTPKRIRCARLDTLIDEHASGRAIDFLKIDVEGAEREVLSSFNPEKIRPTVILIEAISPLDNRQNHEEWEPLLVGHGYVFAAFDGINRFYVPVERMELIETLAYPISVLDRYKSADVVSERSCVAPAGATERAGAEHLGAPSGALRMEQELQKSASENRTLAVSRDQATAELRAIQTTVSWRLTRPLRAVRTAQLRRRRPVLPASVERHASSAAGVVRNVPGASEVGPVFEVTGVASTEILRRCATRQPADRLRPQAHRWERGASPTSPARLTSSSFAPRMSSCSATPGRGRGDTASRRAGCRAPATRDPDATRAVAGRTSLSAYAGVGCHAADTRRHRTRARARGEDAGLWRGRAKSRTVRTS